MPRRGSIAGPLEPQLAGLEGTDVTHVGSGTEGSATPVPGGNPGQIGVKRQEQEPRRSNRKRRTLRRVLFTVTVLLAIVAAGVAWVGVDALRARGELRAAATQVHVLQDQVEKGDRKAAAERLKSMQG